MRSCFVLPSALVVFVAALSVPRVLTDAPDADMIDSPSPSSSSIPIDINFSSVPGMNFAQQERMRAQNIINGLGPGGLLDSASNLATGKQTDVTATNALVTYTVNVGVGKPPTQYKLLIDTGSSNTWIGAGKPYYRTSTSYDTKQSVEVTYGSGEFSGHEYLDSVTIGPQLAITNQSIGVASSSKGFSGVDGILGIGPIRLTYGTLSPAKTQTIPTVVDNLYTQKRIAEPEIGIFFQPTILPRTPSGELTFGGVDSTKTTGPIQYVPVTTTQHASFYWGIDESITYGSSTPILNLTAGIVDTGTTLVLIATDAFEEYVKVTGAVMDPDVGLLSITDTQYAALQSLYFNIGGVPYELTPNAQLWPRAFNTQLGGQADKNYLIVADLGSPSGKGLDFINGYAFLQRYYSAYDTANKRVGFAPTAFTYATSN